MVTTNVNQSRRGAGVFEVRISTISPFLSFVLSGTILPFTNAPTVLCPTSEWIRYEKSTGVASFGKSKTSPPGVNANT